MTSTAAEKELPPVQAAQTSLDALRPTWVELLDSISEALEHAGIRWCLLHGYDREASPPNSDIDCLLGAETDRVQLAELIRNECHKRSARILRSDGLYFLLSGGRGDSPFFLHLDFAVDCDVNNFSFYAAEEVLNSSRSVAGVRTPSVDIEFGVYLTRCVAKRSFTPAKLRRLSKLYAADPEGCARQIRRFWNDGSAATIAAAAEQGDWTPVTDRFEEIRAELLARAGRATPSRHVANALRAFKRRVSRLRTPPGLHIVFLGCDGAGKSTIIAATEKAFSPIFSQVALYGFAPELVQRTLHGKKRRTDDPHGLQARSPFVSIARALLYWFPYYFFGYCIRYVELLRSTLILNDRHFVDVLVDAKRYRYGGPAWLLRAIWRLIPKPDLVLLLDAPAEVLFARKQEIPFALLAEQRLAYRNLIDTLPYGRVIRTDRELPIVLAEVNAAITEALERKMLSKNARPQRTEPGLRAASLR